MRLAGGTPEPIRDTAGRLSRPAWPTAQAGRPTNAACSASILAYQGLVARATETSPLRGGLLDWEGAGYQLEGEAMGDVATAQAKP